LGAAPCYALGHIAAAAFKRALGMKAQRVPTRDVFSDVDRGSRTRCCFHLCRRFCSIPSILSVLAAMAFMFTSYFYVELGRLADTASELQTSGEEKDAQMRTLKLLGEEKDSQLALVTNLASDQQVQQRAQLRILQLFADEKDAKLALSTARVNDLEVQLQKRDADFRTLQQMAKRKDSQNRELIDRAEKTAELASRASTFANINLESAKLDRAKVMERVAEQSKKLDRLHETEQAARALLQQQTLDISGCRTETVHLQSSLDEARLSLAAAQDSSGALQPILQDLDDRLRYSEEDRGRLIVELNATRTMALEADRRSESAIFCCDSVPMCNLCRMRN